jgi:hypothetical protein
MLIRLWILLFSPVTFKMPRKNIVFALITFFKVHLQHSSKIKVIKKSQNSRNQGFLNFLLVYGRIRIRTNKLWICKHILQLYEHAEADSKGGVNARGQLQARERVEQAQSQSRSHPQSQSRIVKIGCCYRHDI